MADPILFDEAYKATAPGPSLDAMSLETLKAHHAYFVDLLPDWLHKPGTAQKCRGRIDLLAKEIELRLLDERNKERHLEAIGQGSKILFWARFAVLVGVVVPILVALIAEIPLSTLLPSTTSQPSP